MSKMLEVLSTSPEIVISKKKYEREPRNVLELIKEWKTAFETNQLLKLGRKKEPEQWFNFSQRIDLFFNDMPVDEVLILQDIPSSLVRKLEMNPQIVLQHCAPNSSVSPNIDSQSDLLHGDVVIEDFTGKKINNSLLYVLLNKMGIKINKVSQETSNWSTKITDNTKIDPLIGLVASPTLISYIERILNIKINSLEELTNIKYKNMLWGVLYLTFKHDLMAGEFGKDYEVDTSGTNQYREIINPDEYNPKYIRADSPYGKKLSNFGMGKLDIDMSYEEYEESLREILNIPNHQKVINWEDCLSKIELETRKFIDKYPYLRLGVIFLVNPYLYKTNSTLLFRDFSKKLNKALNELSGRNRTTTPGSILKISHDATKLHEIDGVPNYDINDGKNTVGIVISRSSGFCKRHIPPDL